MKGLDFVEKLREESKRLPLLKRNYFIVAGQGTNNSEDDTTIVMVNQTSKAVMCAFTYDRSGLIYNMSFGNIGFVELCELTDTIRNILEKENLWN